MFHHRLLSPLQSGRPGRAACGRNTDQLVCPSRANTEAAAGVLPRRAIIGLHRSVGPAPLPIASKGFVRLDGNPIRPFRENRCGLPGLRCKSLPAIEKDCAVAV